MVRRPTEIFLEEEEQPPKDATEGRDGLSQEELLKLPAHIPQRSKKDPRELKILDSACGSGHFLLYCFDLLLTIYEEAYADPDLGPSLQKDYAKLEDMHRDIPRLILAYNLHGIDIDIRASQIAANPFGNGSGPLANFLNPSAFALPDLGIIITTVQ